MATLLAVRVRSALALPRAPLRSARAVIGVAGDPARRRAVVMRLDEHLPARPSFDCADCAQPWPCAPAKVRLSEEFVRDQLSLRLYLNLLCFEAISVAVQDHDWGRVDNLYERFVGWTACL